MVECLCGFLFFHRSDPFWRAVPFLCSLMALYTLGVQTHSGDTFAIPRVVKGPPLAALCQVLRQPQADREQGSSAVWAPPLQNEPSADSGLGDHCLGDGLSAWVFPRSSLSPDAELWSWPRAPSCWSHSPSAQERKLGQSRRPASFTRLLASASVASERKLVAERG